MKKLLLLALIVFVVFVAFNRHRLFLRDPLAKIMIDGQVESNTRVYINIDNDVMLEHTVDPVALVVVQHEQHLGTPAFLHCLRWTACLTDAYPASLVVKMNGTVTAMSSKLVAFTDDKGRNFQVTLR